MPSARASAPVFAKASTHTPGSAFIAPSIHTPGHTFMANPLIHLPLLIKPSIHIPVLYYYTINAGTNLVFAFVLLLYCFCICDSLM